MKSKLVLAALVIGFFLVLFVVWSNGVSSTTASIQGVRGSLATSSLVTAEALYDFGTISMKAGNVSTQFLVTNVSDQEVLLKTILTSCMCTVAFVVESDGGIKGPFSMAGMGYVPPANETIKSGDSRTIRVVYDPNAHGPAGVGAIHRFVTLTEDSGASLQLEIKAVVTP